MKINWILLSVALLLVFSASSFAEDPDSNMVVTAKISQLYDYNSEMVIAKDSTFELEIYFFNNWGNSAAISLPLYWFEETGGVMNVNYLGTGDFGIIDFRGSPITETFIKEYNGWTDYWPAMILHDYYGFGLDASLPDSINFTGADLFGTGWLVEDTTLHIGIVMQITDEGVFCVDSCQIPDGTPQPDQYNWLFEDTSYAFFGSIDVPSTPLCWTVADINSDVQELEKGILPTEFDLGQNYPNPFNPSTKLEFAVPHNSNVNISVFNILGQKITTLVDNEYAAGYYSVDWDATSDDGSEVASGIYFYKIEADNYTNTKKLMLIR